jgi:hypothetical protein
MGTIRHHRTLIAWLALAALIGNLAAGLFCSVPLRSPSLDPLAGAVICTSHGEQAPADENGAPPPPPSKPCQICTAAVALSLILFATALLGLLPKPRPRWAAFRLVTAVAHRLRRNGLGSRAPPLPA